MPRPCPPCSSAIAMPGQPSSTSSAHRSASYALPSAAARTFSSVERLASRSRAVRLISCWSSVKSKFMKSLLTHPREAQNALRDDVLEDLGGAALDGVAAGAQQLVGPAVAGRQRVGTEQVGRELRELLVGLRPHPLGQRALGARRAVLLDRRQPAVGGQAQDLGLQVQLPELVGDDRVVEQIAPAGLLDELVEHLAQADLQEEGQPRALVHERRQ